jgi:hypothetical protein
MLNNRWLDVILYCRNIVPLCGPASGSLFHSNPQLENIMPRIHEFRDPRPWPASALSTSDMHLLYVARETLPVRRPITKLLAEAVRETFGHLAHTEVEVPQPERERVAA